MMERESVGEMRGKKRLQPKEVSGKGVPSNGPSFQVTYNPPLSLSNALRDSGDQDMEVKDLQVHDQCGENET